MRRDPARGSVNGGCLDRTARAAGARIIGALAARFRDLDIAEDAFAEACARAARAWPSSGEPRDPAAWLYRAAERSALDAVRRRKVRDRWAPSISGPDVSEPAAEDALIPDERLRLIFICCHPAVAAEARAALTLRLVCGLSVPEIARAFLVSEVALAQRLTRAKRKIARAGVPFETPRPPEWTQRLDAVLSTLEVAYAKAHEDAAGSSAHAGFAREMLDLTGVLAELLPTHAEPHALAALVRYAEARRPARLDEHGAMVPLSEQDPRLWRRALIVEADAFLAKARSLGPAGARTLQAGLHGLWCARPSLDAPAPWPAVLSHYDQLLAHREDVVVRINRAVALGEVSGVAAALRELGSLDPAALAGFAPYHAVMADLLRRAGQREQAREAYRRVLALAPAEAERLWLTRRLTELG